jgi:ribosomal protein S18 acetylase RimI-like enzyme
MPSAFLPSLGDAFLAELYRAVAREPGAVALVADNGAGVVGFATGVASVGGFYRSFAARHGVRAAALAAPSLLRRDVLRKVAETARYPAAAPEGLPPAEVLAIAVDDAHRRDGIGRRLLAGVLEGLADAGASRARVVVDAANEGANRFYASMGFEPAARVVVHRGTESRVWVIGCRSPSRSPSA